MALYLIGDVQGCNAALGRLLDTLDFSPSRDTAFVLGDLVNRGPDSAGVLRRLMRLGNAAHCLLGNHDLSLLATAWGHRPPHRRDTLGDVLEAPDRADMLHWLRHQHLAHLHDQVLMVHAGVLPGWTPEQTLSLAAEVEVQLRGPAVNEFLAHMFGNTPTQWHDSLAGPDRWRVIVNSPVCAFAQSRVKWSSRPVAARRQPLQITCPGLMCQAERPPTSPSPLGIGPRWALCCAPT